MLQQITNVLRRAPQHRAIAALDNWPLQEIRVLDHQRNDLVIAQLFLSQAELAIYRFARAQQLARLDFHLLNQVAQLLFAQRLEVVINLLEVDTALPEQFVQLATLASRRLFVDRDLIRHGFYGNIPLTLVASATRSIARI